MHKFTFITLLLIFNIWFNDTNQKYKKAYFASGCFWCVESIYENLKGVKEVNSGYSGGKTTDPTYRQVMSGRTGHAEAIEVIYNPSEITFKTLVNVFFGSHDPTTLNKQGPDRGTQYRSIAFYENSIEKEIIESVRSVGCNLGAVEFFIKDNKPILLEVNPMWGGHASKIGFGNKSFQKYLIDNQEKLIKDIPNVYWFMNKRLYYKKLYKHISKHINRITM